MKRILLVPFLLLAIGIFAQNTSNLTISTTGMSNLKIRFAGKQYSLQDRSITFQSLTPGSYTLSVYLLQPKQFGQGTEYITVFDKSITLTAQKHVEICVLRFGTVAWDEKSIEKDDWNQNYQNPEPDRNWGNGNGNSGHNGNRRVVDDAQFAKVKSAISGEFYDEGKVTMAKVVLKDNWFTAEQLKQLCGLFFYDDKKLVFAKYAYDYCADKGSYFILAQALFYDYNKKELLEYIGNH